MRNSPKIKYISVRCPIKLYQAAGKKIKIENLSSFQEFFIEKLQEIAMPEVKH